MTVTVRTERAQEQAAAPAVDRAAYLYDVNIRHVRAAPIRNDFTYRSYQWCVDLDALPALPRPLRAFAQIRTQDHCCEAADDPGGTLRQVLDGYLSRSGIDLHRGSIRMLTSARVLGHVFNPLTVYWCHERTASGAERLACVVAEVHNTYGQRHRYLLRTDSDGRGRTEKQFYVSPFYEVAGTYSMSLPEPGQDLSLTISLHPPGGRPFVASVRGRRRPADGPALVRRLLGRPLTGIAVSARIRWQGIKLYLRGLPVVPRPHAREDECSRPTTTT